MFVVWQADKAVEGAGALRSVLDRPEIYLPTLGPWGPCGPSENPTNRHRSRFSALASRHHPASMLI